MEVWKDIEGYEGLYRISDSGNVLSLNYKHRGYPALLTPKINMHGYAWVELRKNKKPKQMLVHRLVALAFLDNPNEYPIVNHKDENPLNNNVDNLEWCTRSYNSLYSFALHPDIVKEGMRKTRKRIKQINKNSNEIIREYDSLAEVRRILGKSNFNIQECCLGKRKTAYGYRWEFCE